MYFNGNLLTCWIWRFLFKIRQQLISCQSNHLKFYTILGWKSDIWFRIRMAFCNIETLNTKYLLLKAQYFYTTWYSITWNLRPNVHACINAKIYTNYCMLSVICTSVLPVYKHVLIHALIIYTVDSANWNTNFCSNYPNVPMIHWPKLQRINPFPTVMCKSIVPVKRRIPINRIPIK